MSRDQKYGEDNSRKSHLPVPTGIDRLLRRAAGDDEFRTMLLERRSDAADAVGIELTPSERAILAAISEAQLMDTVARLSPPQPRRRFLRQAAASAVVALGGASLVHCDGCGRNQVSESEIEDWLRSNHNDMQQGGGIRPNMPPEKRPPDDGRSSGETSDAGSGHDIHPEASGQGDPPSGR